MEKLRSGFSGLLCVLVAFVLITPSAEAQNRFGNSILVSENEILVTEHENVYRPGAVYTFRKDNGSWIEHAEITAPNAEMGDHFGRSIAQDGSVLVIGSTGVAAAPGAAHIYERNGDAWAHRHTLSAEDVTAEDRFGAAVAVSDDFAFIGAPGLDEMPGKVYVFARTDDGAWAQHSVLQGGGVTDGATFGARLATDGDNLFVGALRQSDHAGAVYRFTHDDAADVWTEAQVLGGRMISNGSRLGASLELANDRLLAGAPRLARGMGGVMVYEPDIEKDEWTDAGILLPFAASNPPGFGTAVAASGDDVWIGASQADGNAGSVYTYAIRPNGWSAAARLDVESLGRGDMFGRALALHGDVGAVAIFGADYGAGSVAVFERDGTGNWTETARLEGDGGGLPPITGGQVDCDDGKAGLFDCERVDLLSFLPISALGGDRGVQVNDIWGWTDPSTGREYALVGRVDGTSFVDVTDPYNPAYLGNLPKTEGSRGSVWRDIKVYENHAFIVADNAGEHGVQVFDLTKLRETGSEPVTFEAVTRYDGINSAHNIVINTETGFAYAVGSSGGGESCGGGLHMINIQDPLNPSFAGCYSAEGTGRAGTGYTHDAQCLVYNGPDSEHAGREICFGSNETALNVADVTDKKNPLSVATASYPNVSYTHQGWISENHHYFYVNDELDEITGSVPETRTLIWDITDLDDPQLVNEYTWGNMASDHNMYIRGNLMYQSNYASGLRVHDLSDPVNPVEIAYFDTMPAGDDSAGFSGSWSNYPFFESGTIAVSSIDEGLFLLRPREEQGL